MHAYKQQYHRLGSTPITSLYIRYCKNTTTKLQYKQKTKDFQKRLPREDYNQIYGLQQKRVFCTILDQFMGMCQGFYYIDLMFFIQLQGNRNLFYGGFVW
eukprot:TRINITY_DN2717_c0_g2_i10.p6 TRINITY_DN2717_c0_g2~~TRINITY_DN2717_c0_g2_i10.p6  ORF type:complete len:100 (-),score=1.69 TRINITY_DN2717_c0_g2_i10:69-368(-)